jgi:hypothetical protein
MTFEELLRAVHPDPEDALLDKSEESTYWDSCYNFYMENKKKDLTDMSKKQVDWAYKISEGL